MDHVSSGPASGILKPKYRLISALFGDTFNPSKGMDVYIDLNTYLNSLSTYAKYLRSLPFSQNAEQDLVYSILMISKHWKDYVKKWDESRVILYFNDFDIVPLHEQSQLKSYLFPYVNKFQNERYSQLVYYFQEAIKKVETVFRYVPNTYLIRCNRYDSYVIPQILEDYHKTNRPRLIITGQPLFTGYTTFPNTYVILSKFQHTGMTQITDPLSIVKSVTKVEEDVVSTFMMNRVFYNILNAIVGDFDRGICGLTQLGISAFAVNLLRSVEKGEIPKDPKSLESVLPVIDSQYHDYLKKAYPLVDIESHAHMIPKNLIEKTKAQMIDLYDIDGLRSLNIEGLNLLELM